MVKTRQWFLAEKPTDLPLLDGPNPTFKLREIDLPVLKDDEVLLKLLYLSHDPSQRGKLNANIKPERVYVPPVKEGETMHARALGEVVESKSSSYSKGDTVVAQIGWTEYVVLPAKQLSPAKELPGGLSKTLYLGSLGLTGITAYIGLTEVGKITKDDVVVISGAAGATGMMGVQIAKKIVGCKKVIGYAGSDEKCRWVESLGADVCLNYKKPSFKDDVARELPGPNGWANVYFDNVGGEILDLTLTHMARYGRIVCCGAISAYNSSAGNAPGIKNWFEVVSMRLMAQGFIVLDWWHKAPETIEIFKKALADGKLEIEGGEQVVSSKFEDVPKAWMNLFSGGNTGKLITAIQ